MIILLMAISASAISAQNSSVLLLDEDFSLFTTAKTVNIESKLDQYTTMPGWWGLEIYGSGTSTGMAVVKNIIATPAFTCTTGNITISIEVATQKNKKYILLSLADEESAGYLLTEDDKHIAQDYDINATFQTITHTFVYPYTRPFRVRLDAYTPTNIRRFRVWDGNTDATGITEREYTPSRSTIYSINGQSIDYSSGHLSPGLYIVNGKKVYINSHSNH